MTVNSICYSLAWRSRRRRRGRIDGRFAGTRVVDDAPETGFVAGGGRRVFAIGKRDFIPHVRNQIIHIGAHRGDDLLNGGKDASLVALVGEVRGEVGDGGVDFGDDGERYRHATGSDAFGFAVGEMFAPEQHVVVAVEAGDGGLGC